MGGKTVCVVGRRILRSKTNYAFLSDFSTNDEGRIVIQSRDVFAPPKIGPKIDKTRRKKEENDF